MNRRIGKLIRAALFAAPLVVPGVALAQAGGAGSTGSSTGGAGDTGSFGGAGSTGAGSMDTGAEKAKPSETYESETSTKRTTKESEGQPSSTETETKTKSKSKSKGMEDDSSNIQERSSPPPSGADRE
jgi:hypothetical protein